MTERADKLRRELSSLYLEWGYGDEGYVLTKPTRADSVAVEALARDIPEEEFLGDLAILVAGILADHIEQKGLRPADYWRNESLPETLANRLSKALQSNPSDFSNGFRATLKGRG